MKYRLTGSEFKRVRRRAGIPAHAVAEEFHRLGIRPTAEHSIYRLERSDYVTPRQVQALRQLVGEGAFRFLLDEVRRPLPVPVVDGRMSVLKLMEQSCSCCVPEEGEKKQSSYDLIEFFSRLPIIGSFADRTAGFAAALVELLGDVDRVEIEVSPSFPLVAPDESARQAEDAEARPMRGQHQHACSPCAINSTEQDPVRLLERLRSAGYDFGCFHPPIVFTYAYETAYLGTLLLMRRRDRSGISERSIRLVGVMEGMIRSQFVLLSACRQAQEPEAMSLHAWLQELSIEASLSDLERRTLLQRLLGHSCKEIASMMNVTENAVQNRLKRIHRKVGVNSLGEVVARYFGGRQSRVQSPGSRV